MIFLLCFLLILFLIPKILNANVGKLCIVFVILGIVATYKSASDDHKAQYKTADDIHKEIMADPKKRKIYGL